MNASDQRIRVTWRSIIFVVGGVFGFGVSGNGYADALMITRAPSARTIAEISIEDSLVRVELEIGIDDLPSFSNLMPDEIYERLGNEPKPLVERIDRFFAEDFVFSGPKGKSLPARLVSMEPRKRVVRDPISGEPLPLPEDEGETVLFAVWEVSLSDEPASLTLQAPSAVPGAPIPEVGFIVYHGGVAVNDFRYLSAPETVDLDWNDPWYSRFRNRNLWRQFLAPISAFLYIEHFEVRKEIVVRPRDLQRWVDLGLEGKDTIAIEEQEEIKRRVAEFFLSRSPVVIDGNKIEPTLVRIHFLHRSLKRTGVIDPPEELSVDSAILGAIYKYPVEGLPQEVTMRWEMFDELIDRVPSASTDEAGGLPYFLTPDDNILVWRNFLTNPSKPGVVAIAAPPGVARLNLPIISAASTIGLLALIVGSIARARRGRHLNHVTLIGGGVLLVAAVILSPIAHVSVPIPFAGPPALTEDDTEEVLGALLRNIYSAFDFKTEDAVYDTLARSVSGDLLAQIYLETRRGLEIENQGGAQARVQGVELIEIKAEPSGDQPGFEARCVWIVTGSVGHWGHIHQRRNQYAAQFIVGIIDGDWKITSMELLEETRLG